MIRQHAVAYASHGWPVFPLWPLQGPGCSCRDPDCVAPGKHPIGRNWHRSIASVPAAESQWAERLGDRGIGLALGPRSGMWALDVDPRHGGDAELARLETDYGRLPTSLRTVTGGGGTHILFSWPDDGLPLTNGNGLPAGLDVRGEGGFVVLPPSLHASGSRYRWQARPRDGTLDPAPAWLLELVRQRQRSLPTIRGATGEQPLIRPGSRRQALIEFAGALRSMGLCEEALWKCGRAFLEHHVVIDEAQPLDWAHAEQTVRDIARRYPPERNR